VEAPHLLKGNPSHFWDFKAVIVALFEEDLICFGYPQPEFSGHNASTESLRFIDYLNKSKKVHSISPPSCSSHYSAHKSVFS